MIITFDGVAASGKGTLAKKIAEHYGYAYLDTGKLYRAVAYKILAAGQDVTDEKLAAEAALSLEAQDLENNQLSSEEVGKTASIVAAYSQLRQNLRKFQHDFVDTNKAKGVVLDGRDTGSVICPDADIKFFIDARLEVRAQRRFTQLSEAGSQVSYEQIKEQLRMRDERDSKRSNSPLIIPENAYIIDSSDLTIDEVFFSVLDIIKS
jgi:cytidylate kinase